MRIEKYLRQNCMFENSRRLIVITGIRLAKAILILSVVNESHCLTQ